MLLNSQQTISDPNITFRQHCEEVDSLKEWHAREIANRDTTIRQLQGKVSSLEQSLTPHSRKSSGLVEVSNVAGERSLSSFLIFFAIQQLHTLDLASQFPNLNLTGQVRRRGNHPVNSSGGFADIWSGTFNGETVAIKVLRYSLTSLDVVIQRRIFREMKTWERLDHPNVLPLLGYSLDLGTFPALVSPWQPNGTASEYLRGRSEDAVFRIVIGSASGLEHLHIKGIRHGDFKGNNILVSADGTAVICDFGLSKTAMHTFGMTTNTSLGGSARWMAPELLEENAVITRESDVWSCGMTILELFSGRVPFSALNEAGVILKVQLGVLPVLPLNVENLAAVANTCKMCWARNPLDRPSVSQVLFGLKLQTRMQPPSSTSPT